MQCMVCGTRAKKAAVDTLGTVEPLCHLCWLWAFRLTKTWLYEIQTGLISVSAVAER